MMFRILVLGCFVAVTIAAVGMASIPMNFETVRIGIFLLMGFAALLLIYTFVSLVVWCFKKTRRMLGCEGPRTISPESLTSTFKHAPRTGRQLE